MTNNSTNINFLEAVHNSQQTIENGQHDSRQKQNKSSKLLLLNLADLDMDIINLLKAKQCGMIILNDQYEIVEHSQSNYRNHNIQITINGSRQTIAIKNIIRLEACGNYTYIFLQNYLKPVLISKTLKYYVNELAGKTFVRPHQSHLVNRNFVKELVRKPKPFLLLKDYNKVPISRRKVSAFKKWRN